MDAVTVLIALGKAVALTVVLLCLPAAILIKWERWERLNNEWKFHYQKWSEALDNRNEEAIKYHRDEMDRLDLLLRVG